MNKFKIGDHVIGVKSNPGIPGIIYEITNSFKYSLTDAFKTWEKTYGLNPVKKGDTIYFIKLKIPDIVNGNIRVAWSRGSPSVMVYMPWCGMRRTTRWKVPSPARRRSRDGNALGNSS